MTLTFHGHVTSYGHRSRGHSIRQMPFHIDGHFKVTEHLN